MEIKQNQILINFQHQMNHQKIFLQLELQIIQLQFDQNHGTKLFKYIYIYIQMYLLVQHVILIQQMIQILNNIENYLLEDYLLSKKKVLIRNIKYNFEFF